MAGVESDREPSRHRRLTRLFTSARALDPLEREAWIAEACSGDPELEQDLRELLAAHEAEGPLQDEAGKGGLAAQLDQHLSRMDMARADEPYLLPEQIGPYQPKEIIGRGGMAVVYLAQQEAPRRDVALKVLRGDVSREASARIEREADLLARLDHPCIAHIFSAGRAQTPWGEQGYIAMEFVNGRPLMRYVREEGLGVRARVELLARIAEALQVAHGRGIVHRDLKPSNILVQRDGTPKLLDFGVARLRSLDIAESAHTRTGQIVGTLATMSPEQAAGRSNVDERADVYALGVLLFELCADRLPIDTRGLPLHEAIRRIQEDDPVPLGAIRPELRGDIESITQKALEKEPHRRYRDAGAFAQDLRRFLQEQPIVARAQRWRDHARRFARRHRPLVVGVSVAFLGLIVTLFVALFLLGRARAETKRAVRGREAALRLTDLRRLGQLKRKAAELWPADERKLDEFEAWISEARLLVGKLDWHTSLLHEFAERFDSSTGLERLAMEDSVNARINGELWMFDAQQELVQGLTRFAAEGGLFERIQLRRAFAANLRKRTVADLASQWEQAARAVADPNGAYGHVQAPLVLVPRPGLVPLGRDQRTGLLAFALEVYGVPSSDWNPGRGDAAAESEPDWDAVVFLLIPPDQAGAPVFLSAWEIGGLLWRNFEGSKGIAPMDSTNNVGPMTLVSFSEAETFAQRLGGRLPTLDEWERAQAAGLLGTRDGEQEWTAQEGRPWIVAAVDGMTHPSNGEVRSPSLGFRIALGFAP